MRGERHFVLDLHRVSQIDAAGVGELVRAYRTTCEANGTFEVLNPTNRVREVLSRAGLLALVKTNGSRSASQNRYRPLADRSIAGPFCASQRDRCPRGSQRAAIDYRIGRRNAETSPFAVRGDMGR